jgi:ribonuclease-3
MLTHDIKKSALLTKLSRAIAYDFQDSSLALMALTHKSARIKDADDEVHFNNERLEFLGDAVLSLVTADFLYKNRKHLREGDLSRLRAQYVCQENLALGAAGIKLGDYLVSDKAMRASGSNLTPAVLADALEAIFGAVYIDGGLEKARLTVFAVLGEPSLKISCIEKDAKTKLQEVIQANIHQAPKYVVLDKHGPAHAPTFLVGVKVKDKLLASASGENLKIAAQNAAVLALSSYSSSPIK